jgi:ribosome-associated translation inhibitor RaiA
MIPSITYRGLDRTDGTDEYVRKRAEKLIKPETRVRSCRVVIDAPPKHPHHGGHYAVRIEVDSSAGDFVVDRSHGDDPDGQDLYAAIDAAFDRGLRRLHDQVERAASIARRARK